MGLLGEDSLQVAPVFILSDSVVQALEELYVIFLTLQWSHYAQRRVK